MDQLNLLNLRRRMGWTTSDLARQLGMSCSDLRMLEETGSKPADQDLLSRIEFLFRQADMCSDEVKQSPLAENVLEKGALGQIATIGLRTHK